MVVVGRRRVWFKATTGCFGWTFSGWYSSQPTVWLALASTQEFRYPRDFRRHWRVARLHRLRTQTRQHQTRVHTQCYPIQAEPRKGFLGFLWRCYDEDGSALWAAARSAWAAAYCQHIRHLLVLDSGCGKSKEQSGLVVLPHVSVVFLHAPSLSSIREKRAQFGKFVRW